MASKPKKRKVVRLWPAQYGLDVTIRELIDRAETVDEAAAMEEPQWQIAVEVLIQNDFIERAEQALLGDYELNATMVRREHLDDPSVPIGASQMSWSLYIDGPEIYDAVAGGPADDFAQAKRFARMAYQATCGVVVGKDNELIVPSKGGKLPPLPPPPWLPGEGVAEMATNAMPARTKPKTVRRRPRQP